MRWRTGKKVSIEVEVGVMSGARAIDRGDEGQTEKVKGGQSGTRVQCIKHLGRELCTNRPRIEVNVGHSRDIFRVLGSYVDIEGDSRLSSRLQR